MARLGEGRALLFLAAVNILTAILPAVHHGTDDPMTTTCSGTIGRRLLVASASMIAVLNITFAQPIAPQDYERDTRRLVVNADGSITYIEPFGPGLTNRLEYHSRPRHTIDLYSHKPD
jgi:hypothetical protein